MMLQGRQSLGKGKVLVRLQEAHKHLYEMKLQSVGPVLL